MAKKPKERPKQKGQSLLWARLFGEAVSAAKKLHLWLMSDGDRRDPKWEVFDGDKGGLLLTYRPLSRRWWEGGRTAGVADSFREVLRRAAELKETA